MINLHKVWDRTGIELATPGSAVRHVSVARYVTDCVTFFVIVEDCSAATLIPIIKRYVKPGSILTVFLSIEIKNKEIAHAQFDREYMVCCQDMTSKVRDTEVAL